MIYHDLDGYCGDDDDDNVVNQDKDDDDEDDDSSHPIVSIASLGLLPPVLRKLLLDCFRDTCRR